jgi:hypothetical protein
MKKILAFGAAFALAQFATAGVVINILENGSNVDVTLSGSIDTAALGALQGQSTGFNGYLPTGGNISMNSSNSEYFAMDVNWTPFGPGGFGNWDVSGGDAFHMFSNPVLGIPVGYVSNSPLSASASKLNSSFAALGFDIGTYVTTLTGPNGVSDTVTVNVGIPAPGSAALLGLAGLATARRRR